MMLDYFIVDYIVFIKKLMLTIVIIIEIMTCLYTSFMICWYRKTILKLDL